VRSSDGIRIGELQAEFSPATPEQGLAELADEVVELLSVLGPAEESPAYKVPGPRTFASYLLRLEQMLAVRCASMEGVPPNFLNGEHEILMGELDLCLAEPANVPARLLLQGTFAAMEKLKPEVTRDFAGKLEQLKRDHPMPDVEDLQF
jgi:hypothetical protein